MSGRTKAPRDRAMELINATWNDPQIVGMWSGTSYGVMVMDTASATPRILLDVSASTADEAWMMAMRDCFERVDYEILVIESHVAYCKRQTERLRRQRRRIVAAINSIDTKGETP